MKPDQLSQTAAFVAIKFYGLSRIEAFHTLFDDSIVTFYDRLIQSLPAPLCYYHYWLKFGWVRKLYIWSEELLLPGDLLHIVARKWYIQRITQNLVDEGYEQIIVLGAGFDHLSFYFSHQGLPCFELDAPRMATLKQQFFNDFYPDKIHPQIVSSHLPDDDLKNNFEAHPEIDPDKKTIVVAEGFFDYLEAQTVTQSLQLINNYFMHKPALISTHFALDELSFFYRWVFKTSVNMVDEQLQLKSTIKDFKILLTKAEYHISQQYDAQEISAEIKKRTGTNLPVLDGFYVLLAR